MTVQDVDNAFRKKADASVKLFGLRKKIENGTATMEDAAQYQTMLSKILGQTIGESILNIPESERVKFLDWILRNQYQEANDRLAVIQEFLDKQQGIHIAPQKAPFPAERVEKLGKSLTDPTVPGSTIRRRARAGTETVSKSFHDDYVKTNAKFRSRAGLKCFITRKAVSGCCPWCSKVAGRYRYGEEPDDIYRRHDNCDCTVTFENGRKRQDVWSKREWEVPEKDAGAADATVLTAEQAAENEAKHQPTVLTGGKKPAIIKNIELPPETSEIRSMSDETRKAISDAFDRITAAYDVRVDELITTALDKKYSKVPFQFQPIKGENGELIIRIVINSGYDFMGSQKKLQARIMRNHDSGMLSSTNIDGLIAHELAHAMTFQDIKTFNGYLAANKALAERCVEGISIYADAMGDGAECIAEAFAAKICGQPISQEAQALLDEFVERRRKHEK